MFSPFQNIQALQLQPRYLTSKTLRKGKIEYVTQKTNQNSINFEIEDGLNPSSILDLDIGNLNLSLNL